MGSHQQFVVSLFLLQLLLLSSRHGISGGNNRLELKGCSSVVRLQTNQSLENLFPVSPGIGEQRLTVGITLQRTLTEKGCGHSTYNPEKFYNACGITDILTLLPTHIALPSSYAKHVATKTTDRGGLDYIFDGVTAIRFPPDKLQPYWYQEYTISGWVRPDVHPDRQYIISWSDGDTPRHQNTGFFLTRRYGSDFVGFGFHHKHTEVAHGRDCIVTSQWRVPSTTGDFIHRWYFFSLNYRDCKAELSVNGQMLNPSDVGFTYGLPAKHIQPKFVLGARWTFGVTKYKEYFHGRISGLILKPGKIPFYDWSSCLLRCRESLRLGAALPDGLQEEELDHGWQLIIEGENTRPTFESLLNDIVYINENPLPLLLHRSVVMTTRNEETGNKVVREVDVSVTRQSSVLSIRNDCGKQEDANLLTTVGMRMCPDLVVVLTGCLRHMDTLTVTVHPQLTSQETLFVPQDILNKHNIAWFSREFGFVLHGVADVEAYTELLKHLRFLYKGTADIARTFTISASSHNGLIRSNDFTATLKTASGGRVYVSPNSRHEQPDNFVNLVRVQHDPADPPRPSRPIQYQHPQQKKGVAMGTSTRNGGSQGYIGWMALACAFSVTGVLLMVGYGVRKRNRPHNTTTTTTTTFYDDDDRGEHSYFSQHHDSYQLSEQPSLVSIPKSNECVSPDFYWDDQGLSMRLIINPSERISILHDPYNELLSKQRRRDVTSYDDGGLSVLDTEGSVYSEEDFSDFDTDSIRQLEWDWLENNLEEVLEEDRMMTEIREGKRKKEELYEEVFL